MPADLDDYVGKDDPSVGGDGHYLDEYQDEEYYGGRGGYDSEPEPVSSGYLQDDDVS